MIGAAALADAKLGTAGAAEELGLETGAAAVDGAAGELDVAGAADPPHADSRRRAPASAPNRPVSNTGRGFVAGWTAGRVVLLMGDYRTPLIMY